MSLERRPAAESALRSEGRRAAAPASARRHGAGVRLISLSKRFGDANAVEDVSLEVRPGEFLTLLGPSGSGKTTTLMMIAGFERPAGGRILFDDAPVTHLPPNRRNIGVVFQQYALFPHLSVQENVAFPLRARALGEAEIAEHVASALRLVQLEGYERRMPSELSGGQQQRVALARAVVFSPTLLLMDEPLGALDKNLRFHMQIELKRIQRVLGVTVLYVTHDQEEALVLSDRIAVMNRGRIEQVGTPIAVYDEPRTRFVAEFLGESNLLPARVTGRGPDGLCVEVAGGGRCAVEEAGQWAAGTSVNVLIRPERIRLYDWERCENRWTGRVEEATFLGESFRYVVRVSPECALVVKAQAGAGDPFSRGAAVQLGWRPRDVKLMRGEMRSQGAGSTTG